MPDEREEKPQGPTDPSGPGGADAPAPPGGPQRTDQPDGMQTPGEAATGDDAEPKSEPKSEPEGEPRGENDVPEPTTPEPGQGEAAREAQEENAETSLDQPSQ